MRIDDAYRPGMQAQLAAYRARLAAGMPRLGWKLGINVPEVLAHFDVSHSAVGWLDGERRLASGTRYTAPEAARLRVEPELCLRLGRDVAAADGPEAARAAVEGVAPALELVDMPAPPASLDELVAGSMLHHATVLGDFVAPALPEGLGRDLPVLSVDGAPGPAPRDDLVASDPGVLLHFTAGFLEPFGEALRTGDLLICGSFTAAAPPLAAGQSARADFGPLGHVEVTLAGR